MSDKQELNMEEMGQVAGGWTQWKIPHMARRV